MTAARAGDHDGFYVTALGTGASALDNERASVGYVVHVDGDPTLLVDAGGGTAARLSEARIDPTALDAVFLGHLHVDHTADVPAIVKAASQQGRGDRPLAVYGPAGNAQQPGTEQWLSTLFDEGGAYGYLSDFVERYTDGELALPATEVDATVGEDDEPERIYEGDGVAVDAIPVVHGRVPALAYRVSSGGRSITFSGDYAAESGNVPTIARGTDVLVHHRVLADDADGPKTALHPSASACGRTARAADVGTLALSHVGRDDPADLEPAIETVRDEYDGRVVVLRDLVDVYPDGTVVDARSNPETGPGTIDPDDAGPDVVYDDRSDS
ncbi:MBL fold metallo-hydrolase [Halosolutus amylolyticus]|uniref:MBL fold metallo-hydrolase n=1 Tax=Halosolutus amylolyticus TaxID=2932267 RepID=A0ABD5PKT3_9EURY|nr:MBL fold metallo-hydrolase [Halosolutus amylolyticus]